MIFFLYISVGANTLLQHKDTQENLQRPESESREAEAKANASA
jgi:hypothetical protein